MKKESLLFLTLLLFVNLVWAQDGPYPPAAGLPGSTAIHKDSSVLIGWANGLKIQRGLINISDPSAEVNGSNVASFGFRSLVLGPVSGASTNAISLGDNGVATITFDRPIVNGDGYDFAVFENGFTDNFLELAFVEVSSDGENFYRFPAVSLTTESTQIGGFGALDPTHLHNLAGKYRTGYGTPFDLDELSGTQGLDVNNVRFIRIVDVVGSIDPAYATYDSQNNIVNDPFPTPFNMGGFDLSGVGIINAGKPFFVSDFLDLELADDAYNNGANLNGEFISGMITFHNEYNPEWDVWSGWAFSNQKDITTEGFLNQYSAFAGGGMASGPETYEIFGIGSIISDFSTGQQLPNSLTINSEDAHIVAGMYLTNTTYTALSMLNGDGFAKKFGGQNGDEPDWFKLTIWGTDVDNNPTDSIDFFLGDYRFDDNTLDYIVDEWTWVDLYDLGPIKSINFALSSSDEGAFGMNTPGYFAVENITVVANDIAPNLIAEIPDYVLSLEEEKAVIELSNYFDDVDDGFNVLEFSVEIEDPSLVSYNLNEGILTIDPLAIGSTDVYVKAQSFGKSVTTNFNVTVESLVSNQELLSEGITVYPNPFSQNIIVDLLTVSNIRVFDISGTIVYQENEIHGKTTLTLNHLASGVYVIEINNGNKLMSTKLIKG